MTTMIARHAQSIVNAGRRVKDPFNAGLSELGKRQARDLAAQYDSGPDLIIVSEAPRTQLTARPLLEKFPNTQVQVMPVYEFYFINDYRIKSTTVEERKKMLDEYFAMNDPDYVDGGSCESFNHFIARVRKVIDSLDYSKNTLIISHGHFINGIRMVTEGLPLTVHQFAEMEYVEHAQLMRIRQSVSSR